MILAKVAGPMFQPAGYDGGMPRARKKTDGLLFALLAPVISVLVLLVLYAVGYFALSTRVIDVGYDGAVVRCFNAPWKKHLYYPAASVEQMLIGNRVRVEYVAPPEIPHTQG